MIEREPRYMVIDQSAVALSVNASDYAEAEIDAVLLDISTGGAKLRTRDQIPRGQQLALKLNADELSGCLQVDATVCWTQLASQGTWSLGCSFQPPIPRVVLNRLAESGIVDRREDDRQEVSIASMAAWELTSEVGSVCIVNMSPHGFCLASQQAGKPGARVMLKFEETSPQATVTGRCRWQVKTDEGFTLGCEFSSPQDYLTLRRVQAELESLRSAKKRGLFARLLGS